MAPFINVELLRGVKHKEWMGSDVSKITYNLPRNDLIAVKVWKEGKGELKLKNVATRVSRMSIRAIRMKDIEFFITPQLFYAIVIISVKIV